MRTAIFLFLIVSITLPFWASIIIMNDETLSNLLVTPITDDTPFSESLLAPITRESHPITLPSQLSFWTLGVLWKLPMDGANCSYDPAPANLVTVDIRTTHLLGPKAVGYECWGVREFQSKTFYFLATNPWSGLSLQYLLMPSSVDG